MRLSVALTLLLCSAIGTAQAGQAIPEAVKDPAYGQVLFDLYQQNYFSAITHLRSSQKLGLMPHHVDESELLLGSIYLSYGMQKNAEQTFNQLLVKQIDPALRNRVWLALAEIYFERGYEAQTQELLGRIEGELPPSQEDERLLLEGTLWLRHGDYAKVEARLADYKRDSLERRYVEYNLAMEHIRQGREAAGRALLEPLATLGSEGDKERAALRDKANIALGYSYLRHEEFAQARPWFERVELYGPFASQALLGLGWVDSGLGDSQAALATWQPLIGRNAADPPVLEGLLAVPYTLNQLGAHQQALEHYQKAIAAYDNELNILQGILAGMNSIALAQDLVDTGATPEAGWQWRPKVRSSSVLGPYLYRVMAGQEFQEALRNYRDLLYLERNLSQWLSDLDAYGAMIETRQAAYDERLPQIQKALKGLESDSLRQQRGQLAAQLQMIEESGDASALAEADEQEMLARLRRVESRLRYLKGATGTDISGQWRKLQVLKGVLRWRLETQYPVRLWQLKRGMDQLDASLMANAERRSSLAEAQRRSPSDFERYRKTIKVSRSRMLDLQQQTKALAQQYEGRLQQLTVAALKGMEAQINRYRGQALFAAAQIYDRAIHAQGEEP